MPILKTATLLGVFWCGATLLAQQRNSGFTPSATPGPPTQLVAYTNYPVQALVFRGYLTIDLQDANFQHVSDPAYNFPVSFEVIGPSPVFLEVNYPLPSVLQLESGYAALYGLYFPQPGVYTLTARAVGASLAIAPAVITFNLNVPTFVVTNANDSGPGSLRSAMASADQYYSAFITFQLPPGPNTILLTSGPLTLNYSAMVIRGPGADLLSISGNQKTSVFRILTGVGDAVLLSGLAIKNGFVSDTGLFTGGGGIYVYRSTLWLNQCVVSGNSAAGASIGGGIYDLGILSLFGTAVIGNTAIAGGGGIALTQYLNATNSTITGNSATGTAPGLGTGGGILTGWVSSAAGRSYLYNSTVSGNTAAGDGGGMASVNNLGSFDLISTTVTGNFAAGKGGGIVLEDGFEALGLSLTNSTISANSAGMAGGVYAGTGQPFAPYVEEFADSIIAGNVNGDCTGCDSQMYANFIGGNPLLGPLQNNGGVTETMLPLPGSPVIGAGTPLQPVFTYPSPDPTPATDQRGFPRATTTNVPIDLGAVQTNYALAFSQRPDTVYYGTPASWSVQLQESGRNYTPGANQPAGGTPPAIPVTLSLVSGMGSLFGNSAAADPATGIATFPSLSIAASGSQSLQATSPGFAPATSAPFSIAPVAPASIAATSGSGQSTVVNTPFVIPLQATVRSASGNPLQGIMVLFSVGSNASFAGGAASASTISNASGVATAPILTAGSNVGSFTVTATVGGVASATFTLTATPLGLSFSVQSVNFTVNYGAVPATTSQTFSVSSGIPVTFRAVSPVTWLTVPTGSFTSPISLTATASIAGLLPGLYQTSISFAFAGGSAILPVTLTVVGLPQLVATPKALSFNAAGGQSVKLSQSLVLTSQNRNTSFTVASDVPWIAVTANPPNQTPSTLTITVDTASFVAGSSPASVVVTASDATSNPLTIPVTLTLAQPLPTISPGGIVDAASFLAGPVAPNTILTIFGQFPCGSAAQVLLNGQSAEVLSASAMQINFTLPAMVTGNSSVAVQVVCNGMSSSALQLVLAMTAPAIFTLSQTGQGQAAAALPDWTMNGPANPATAGTSLAVFVTGFGLLSPPGSDGLTRLRLPVSAFLGDAQATVVYSGAAPGFSSGLQQINIQVPPGAPTGLNVPIHFVVGGVSTQAGVTVAIR